MKQRPWASAPFAVAAASLALAAVLAIESAQAAALADTAVLNSDYDELEPQPGQARTSVAIVDRLRHHHLKTIELDDATSSTVFDKYLELLDPKRVYLLASDVESLEKHRNVLDEALEEGDLEPAFEIYNVFRRRTLERIEYEVELLQRGVEHFDFTLDETAQLDRSEAPRPATLAEAQHLWRLGMKSQVLAGKLTGDALEDIGDTLAKRLRTRLRSIRQTRPEDVFQAYVNAFADTYDKHTRYFSRADTEDFNIAMSLSLEGIGAVLGLEDDYTVVQRLVKGGPADLAGELKPSDRIVAVSQSEREPFVDIVGWRTSDVVQLIRGPKGSPVLLKVAPADQDLGETRVVQIVRDVVRLEEQAATKRLLSLSSGGRDYRVGVVSIPTFYHDFEAMNSGDPNYRSTTRDAARLIEELKQEGMEALIVDLRNNGGGSLQEAVELAGLFIEAGPVVQVANLRRPPSVHVDSDGEAAWPGPLGVLVNGLSASASEIFAAAIQDYGLGVVVGSKTFGKGTVQKFINLPAGDLKITEWGFYRVSGEGTEQNGVEPDIDFPSPFGRLDDKRLVGAIDTGGAIEPREYPAVNEVEPILPTLQVRHQQRAGEDPEFAYLRAREAYVQRLRDRKFLSLNEAVRQAEKESDDAEVLGFENARRLARGEPAVATLDELRELARAEDEADETPEADAMVIETGNILIDLIGLTPALASAAVDGKTPG